MAVSEKATYERARHEARLKDFWAEYDRRVIEAGTVGEPGSTSPARQQLRERIQHETLALHIAQSYP